MVRKNLDLSGWNILLADHNEVYVLFMRMYLERCGAKVTLVDNGREALKLALTNNYNLVIYDFGLRGFNGFEFMDSLKKSGHHVPVIGISSADYRGRAIKSGLSGIVNRENQLVEIPEIIYNLQMAVPI
jgi:CheY-like chemotaxis protein